MKIFVGHSFDEKDKEVVSGFIEFLEANEIIKCQTGERSRNYSISNKVKERIDNCDLFVGIYTRNLPIQTEDGIEAYTTSNWVIQESGYAIGKNKEILLLIEDKVHKYPGLQGDQEVIFFNRDTIEKSFTNLQQMLSGLISGNKDNDSSDSSVVIVDVQEEIDNNEECKTESNAENINYKLYKLYLEKDPSIIKNIYENEIKGDLPEEIREMKNASIALLRYQTGDPTAFYELEKIYKESNDIIAKSKFAMLYEGISEYEKAKSLYLAIAETINSENDKQNYIYMYDRASKALSKDNRYDEARELLSSIVNKRELEEYRHLILENLAELSLENKDLDSFYIYAEYSLSLYPTNTDLRFSLAYQYSKSSLNKLSLLHYTKIKSSQNRMALNNLGAQYRNFDLKTKSIAMYKEAAEMNLPLAMSNLAHIYLSAGFINEASNQIERVLKCGEKVHENIGKLMSRIELTRDEEEKNEKIILKEAEEARKFYIKYSQAYLDRFIDIRNKLEISWKTHIGDLQFTFIENTNNFLMNISSRDGKEENNLTIKGYVHNYCGKYEIIKGSDSLRQTLLGFSYKIADGYFIINEEFNRIEVLEKDKDNSYKKEVWTLNQ